MKNLILSAIVIAATTLGLNTLPIVDRLAAFGLENLNEQPIL